MADVLLKPPAGHRGERRQVAARRTLGERLFPGDPGVWRWLAIVMIPLLAVIAYSLLVPRSFYTATNSVGPRSIVTSLSRGQTLCIPSVPLPAGTGRIQLSYGATGPQADVAVRLVAGGRTVARGNTAVIPPDPPGRATIRLDPPTPATAPTRIVSVCVTLRAGEPISFGGFAALPPGALHPTIDGRPINGDPSVWMLPPAGVKRSLIDNWATIMRRLTLFRPGFAGAVFFWLLFLVGLPLLSYCGIRLLAVARTSSPRRLALGLMAVAFLGSAIWAITTVPFDGPDESEHFAYTEYLSETGRAPSATPTPVPVYATDEGLALGAVDHFSFIGVVNDTRPPWLPLDERQYQRQIARVHPARDNGGGEAVATADHSPLYYALLIPGYRAGDGHVFTELFWMRLISALFGAIAVLGAFLTVRELLPSRPELAVAGGLLVAFEPMFSFIAGAVNNDNGVNAMAALAVYLTIRILRRGPTLRVGLALGLVLGLLPLMKGTGFALVPPIALALLAALVQRRSRAALLGVVTAIAGFLVVIGVWALFAHHFGRSVVPVPAGTIPFINAGSGTASPTPGGSLGKVVYLLEVFIPHLPFASQHFASGLWPFSFIYVRRGFAAFGWNADYFPNWVYAVVLWTMVACALLALTMTVRRWPAVRRRWREGVFLLLVIVTVIAGVEFSFYTPAPRPVFLTPEQGRYAFTAIVPLVGLALCGLLAFNRRVATVGVSILVGAMVCFSAASHLLYLAQNFT